MLHKIIRYFLDNKLVSLLLLISFVLWGLITAPFDWQISWLPKDPVSVDAIPDIGENQQIVFTAWPGRSPQDIDDQISYPLTSSLLGIPGVKSIRSSSIFGFSSIYIIFNDDVEFYWSRSRILEKLNSLPTDLLPDGVQPSLGPDATALGQVFWYTIEGRDSNGNATGGWDLHEIRSVQDFYVKYALNASEGVSEVASIGGHVKEYQIDINPDALKAYKIPLSKVVLAAKNSNNEIGAKTIEINQAEYLVRGLGYIDKIEDLEEAVISVQNNVPIRIKDVAIVQIGPATRRAILDKGGAEVVGGVVLARYGANPLEVINKLKEKISEISPGLPKKTLADGSISQLTIVPFYDRSELIYKTIATLEDALSLEMLITLIVVLVLVYNLRASILISSILPISVLMVFIAMRYFNVDANIVALSGIAIAIGTMVDLGIILTENIIKHIDEAPPEQKLIDSVHKGTSEIASAILTAVATTIVSFIPVFTLQAAEGKLFSPLAFTKSFALVAALIVSLLILPSLAHWFFGFKIKNKIIKALVGISLFTLGIISLYLGQIGPAIILIAFACIQQIKELLKEKKLVFAYPFNIMYQHAELILSLLTVVYLLSKYWLPLGPSQPFVLNLIFVTILLGFILGGFMLLEHQYKRILNWCLDNKAKFLAIPTLLIICAACIWLGFSNVFSMVSKGFNSIGITVENSRTWSYLDKKLPGIGKEFMPSLNEGSFLLMPTSMPHSGLEYNQKTLAQLDMLISRIPEVKLAVGKLGRVESALDPAPISMFENIINYKSEYITDEKGHRIAFKVDEHGNFISQKGDTLSNQDAILQNINRSDLIPDINGAYYRNWRKHIHTSDDIWEEIISVSKLPGITSAPKLQPIETRLIMLQTGMRAPMGIKVYGPDLKTIEKFGIELEKILKNVSSVKADAVFADRIVGKPYLLFDIKRHEIARYGLSIKEVHQFIESAVGGMPVSKTVEGRERYAIRVRYPRELRDHPEALANLLITTKNGNQIPLKHIVDIQYTKGPQSIKSEETFLVGYVLFDKQNNKSEMTAVKDAQQAIEKKIQSGELNVPSGVSYKFSGNYENQVRAEQRLSLIVPLVLALVFLILYFQFRSVATTLMVFSGIALAFSGGFIMLWLYGQEWFANIPIFDTNLRTLFQIKSINLSVAVWVGFIALFGIATDDGVLMATYLDQSFKKNKTNSIKNIRIAVAEAGKRRIKPAIMTTATTIIALLPVLSSNGKGSDIMIPMAIPAFGGMLLAAITYFIVPVLYAMREEYKFKKSQI